MKSQAGARAPAAHPLVPRFDAVTPLLGQAPMFMMRWQVAPGFPVVFAAGNLAHFGYTVDDFVSGRVSWPGVTHPEDAPRLEKEVEAVLASGDDVFSQHYRIRNVAGEFRWVEDWNHVLRGRDGRPEYIDGMVMDATDRMLACLAYREVVDSMLHGVGVMQDGFFVLVNAEMRRILGLPADYTPPSRIEDLQRLIHPADRARVKRYHRRRRAGLSAPENYECRVALPDGTVRTVRSCVRPTTWEGRPAFILISIDITAQKAYEAVLRESEQNFRALAENAHEGIFIDRPDGSIVYANRHASRLTGYPRRRLLGASLGLILPPDELKRVLALSERRRRGVRTPTRYDVELLTRAGERVPVEVEVAPTVWQGAPATIGMLRDVRERRRVEAEIRRARQMLEQTQQIARIGSIHLDAKSATLTWSPEVYAFLGLNPKRFRPDARRATELVHPDDRAARARAIERCLGAGEDVELDLRVRHTDGRYRTLHVSCSAVRGPDGDVEGVIAAVQDVTERRREEQQVLAAAREEQLRLGQELHDSLGSELAGTMFVAKALERRLQSEGSPAAVAAAQLAELVRNCAEQCRRIAAGLIVVEMPAESLARELEKLCDGMAQRFGIRCRSAVDRNVGVHDNAVAAHVYYIARESLANAMRHSGATQVRVELRAARGGGRLTVQDNGAWQEPDRRHPGGTGLRILARRAQLIGGRLTVMPSASGTRVACTFPLCPPPRRAANGAV